MKQQNSSSESKPEQQLVRNFAEKAYLDYSMYVILDRALPHIGDGLKPVQRRIVYAMSQLGLEATAKYKKSARTIGDVLGKFHPHGDSACYEAMVLMAQSFSTRYTLIDGQGNWGSPDDPKSFAAMRYTESRLTPYAELLLAEVSEGTVEWVPNFDGTLKEPKYLPARIPNVLLNGATGIAVGMATDILPHNLREVVRACILLLENPKAKLEEIMEYVKGPDFATRAEIITPQEDIVKLYQQGVGSIRQRATYTYEKGAIIITALPHQVSGSKVLEQIAEQMTNKKLPMVVDIRDESDHENPTRLVLILKSNRVDVESLMLHLFATTDLEKSYRANFNMIGVDGRPRVMGLLELLKEWLSYRIDTVRKKLQFKLDHQLDRLHILEGFLAAYLNLDKVIKIIRFSDDPKEELIKLLKITDKQVEAILNLRLRQLSKLEESKIRDEQKELEKECQELKLLLDSPAKLKKYIRKELEADALKYGDDRRSPLVTRTLAQAMKVDEIVSNEPVTVILSMQGWIRAAKGHEIDPKTLSYRAGDTYKMSVQGRTNQSVIIFDSSGRIYSLPTQTLPSARGQGEPLTKSLNSPPGAQFVGLIMESEGGFVLIAQDTGYGFITSIQQLIVKNRSGRQIVNLMTGSQMLAPRIIIDREKDWVALMTSEGKLLCFPIRELPELNKGKGNKMINIPSGKLKNREEYVKDAKIFNKKEGIIIHCGKKSLKLQGPELEKYCDSRAKRGLQLPKNFKQAERFE